MKKIIPALLSNSFAEIEQVVEALAGMAIEAQLDIVDGQFVPRTSWPFSANESESEWQKLAALNDRLPLEVDMMVSEPEQYLEKLHSLGIRRVILHFGSTENLNAAIEKTRELGLAVGLAITSEVTLDEADEFIKDVDWVQVMGIKEVGQQAEPFDERTPDTLRQLHDKYPQMPLAVDGSVNETTIPVLLNAGANRLAVGSAISQAPDMAEAYQQLQALLRN